MRASGINLRWVNPLSIFKRGTGGSLNTHISAGTGKKIHSSINPPKSTALVVRAEQSEGGSSRWPRLRKYAGCRLAMIGAAIAYKHAHDSAVQDFQSENGKELRTKIDKELKNVPNVGGFPIPVTKKSSEAMLLLAETKVNTKAVGLRAILVEYDKQKFGEELGPLVEALEEVLVKKVIEHNIGKPTEAAEHTSEFLEKIEKMGNDIKAREWENVASDVSDALGKSLKIITDVFEEGVDFLHE
eukprot:g2776.t1